MNFYKGNSIQTESNYRDLIIPILLFIVGMYILPLRIVGLNFEFIPGDLGDSRFNNIVLEHGYLFIMNKVDWFWNAHYMYPSKLVIARSDNLLGTLPIYAASRFVGFDRYTAFQLWFIILHALNYIFCYWAVNKLFKNSTIAAIGAYVFAFGIFNIGQIYHAQIYPRFMLPLIFYWTIKFLQENKSKHFSFLVFSVVYQFYCGIYLGFFSLYSILFIAIGYFLVYRDFSLFKKLPSKKDSIIYIGSIASSLALLYALFKPYLIISKETGMRPFNDVIDSIPHLGSYLFSSPASFIWSDYLFHPFTESINIWWTHMLFPGILPIASVLVAAILLFFVKKESIQFKFLAFLVLSTFLSVIFCLNLDGKTLYKFIYEIPGFSSMRALNRIINSQVVFFILTLSFVLQYIYRRWKWGKYVVLAIVPLIVLDNYFVVNDDVIRYKKADSISEVDAIKAVIQKSELADFKAIAYNFKDKSSHRTIISKHLSVITACQDLDIQCVNGYSGSYPNNYMSFFDLTDQESLNNWLDQTNTPHSDIILINE